MTLQTLWKLVPNYDLPKGIYSGFPQQLARCLFRSLGGKGMNQISLTSYLPLPSKPFAPTLDTIPNSSCI